MNRIESPIQVFTNLISIHTGKYLQQRDEGSIIDLEYWDNYKSQVFEGIIGLLNFSLQIWEKELALFTEIKDQGKKSELPLKYINRTITDLLVLALVYSNLLDEDPETLDSKEQLTRYLLVDKLNQISQNYFNPIIPQEVFSETYEQIGALNKIVNLINLQFFSNNTKVQPETITRNQTAELSNFFTNILIPSIERISNLWWWDDHLAKYHLYSLANRKLLSVFELHQQPGDLEGTKNKIQFKSEVYPLLNTRMYYSLSLHTLNTSIKFITKGKFEKGLRLLQDSEDFCRIILHNIVEQPPHKIEDLLSYKLLFNRIKFLIYLGNSSVILSKIFHSLDDRMKIKELLQELKALENEHSVYSYLGMVIENSFISTAKLLEVRIEKNQKVRIRFNEITFPINGLSNSIYEKLHQYIEIMRTISFDDIASVKILFQIQKELIELDEVICFLPSELDKRNVLITSAKGLLHVINSLVEYSRALNQTSYLDSFLYQLKATGLLNQIQENSLTHLEDITQINTAIITKTKLSEIILIRDLAIYKFQHQTIREWNSVCNLLSNIELSKLTFIDNLKKSQVEFFNLLQMINQEELNEPKKEEIPNIIMRIYDLATQFLIITKLEVPRQNLKSKLKVVENNVFQLSQELENQPIEFSQIREHVYKFGIELQEISNNPSRIDLLSLEFFIGVIEAILSLLDLL